ncbi:MAG: hypothetical protein FJX93_03170 [Bacteroidetes bacterium]|nr:hypothetical protein [Bacteroidota bacterium]
MKKLLRRLLWYGFGVGLGVLLVGFLFRDRDFECSYFPNDRVLAELHRKPVCGADSTLWNQLGADSAVLRAFLTLGEVDFSESQTRTRHDATVPAYWIDVDFQDRRWRGLWEVRRDSAWLVRLEP